MHFLLRFKSYLFLLCLFSLSCSLYAFIGQSSKKLEVAYEPTEIVLSNGRILKDYVATGEGKLFIPYELVENIVSEQIFWDEENHVLHVGSIPTASVMSDKIKIYHYDYDDIRSFLYCPDAKTNKAMTMANDSYAFGYYFTNVFSASFNLEGNYHHISGYLGCEDFKASNGQVDFYLDDVLLQSYTLKADALPEKIDLDVSDGKQLKLAFFGFKPDTQIDFADVYIN